MPALPDDIFAGSRDAATATWESAEIAGRHPSARDATLRPALGFFDTLADAQTVANERGALIGAERRRFSVLAYGPAWPSVAGTVPQARLIDAEQATDGTFLAARIEIDLEAETSSYELFG